MTKRIIGGIVLMLFSGLSLAHPGHDLTTAVMGLKHTLTGWDHLLMMLAVGVFAAKSNGNGRIWLPVSFILFMLLGACLGMLGVGFSALETTVAASVVAMALLLMLALTISNQQRILLVAIFATLHGLAHGVAINGQQGYQALFGMLLATAMLLGLGYWVGVKDNSIMRFIQHVLTYAMLLLGGFFLFN